MKLCELIDSINSEIEKSQVPELQSFGNNYNSVKFCVIAERLRSDVDLAGVLTKATVESQ